MQTSNRVDITVVVPVHNRAGLVMETLDSVARQNVLPRRVVLVDDHSMDGSLEVLNDFALKTKGFEVVVLSSTGRGACAARNAGLEKVETEWTMFFDSDDLMDPAHIERAWQAVTDNPDADVVGWDVDRIEIDGRRRRLIFDTTNPEWSNIMHGTFATQRYMAKTSLFREAGGWNEEQPIWNDIELGARLLKQNPKIVKAASQKPTVIIRANADSITGALWSDRIDRYRIALANLSKTLDQQKAPWISLKSAVLAADIAREDKAAGKSFYEEIVGRGIRTRLVYEWRKAGMRGAARVFKPLFRGKVKS